jgi:hypothetical protein
MKYAVLSMLVLALGFVPALAQTSDTTAPLLGSFFFTPISVDVSNAPQTVTVSAVITDDLSGFNFGNVRFTSPNGQFIDGFFTRTGGTGLAGSYQAVVTMPRFIQAGVWKAQVTVRDFAGNSRTVATGDLQAHSFPTDLTVLDSVPDVTPPTITGVSFSPASVDVSSNDVNVTVSLQITDNLSGVCFNNAGNCGYNFDVVLAPPATSGSSALRYISSFDIHLASGSAVNGTWQGVVKIPRFSASGSWHIQSINLRDVVTNSVFLNSAQLQAAGINPILSVSSVVSDPTPPALTGLVFSPPLFNTSTGQQTVNITVSASDNLSGVDFSPTTATLAFYKMYFYSPSGGQFVAVSPYDTPVTLAGGPLSGTFQFSAIWPRFSEEGTWQMTLVLYDAVGNQVFFTPAMFQALGLPSTVVVTKPSLNTDGTVGATGGTVSDNSFGTRASVTFPAGVAPDNTNVSIDVFPNPLPVPTPSGFTVPGTYFVNVAFSPALSSPLPSPGITVVLPLLTPMTPGAHLSLYHIDPVTGTLQPATDASHHTPVQGTVNSGGVSVTFLNVVTLSTVVAFLPSGSVIGDVNTDGLVNCTDVSLLRASFGKRTGQPGFNLNADLNNDGVVDIRDLMVVTRQLPAGTTCQ